MLTCEPKLKSQLERFTGSPPSAKPHEWLFEKYHSLPLALLVTLPEPASKSTSARGAAASSE